MADIAELLAKLNEKFDKQFEKFDDKITHQFKEFEQRFNKLENSEQHGQQRNYESRNNDRNRSTRRNNDRSRSARRNNGGNNARFDSNRRGQNNNPTSDQPDRDIEFWSDNTEFPALVKEFGCLYRIQNADDNWSAGIPVRIQKFFDKTFDSIKPPRPNEKLKKELEGVKHRMTDDLKRVIKQHLKDLKESTTARINELNKTDAGEAIQTARRQLQKSLPKMKHSSVQNVTDELQEGWTTVRTRNRTRQTAATPQTDTTSTTNRFEVLMEADAETSRKRPRSQQSSENSTESVEPATKKLPNNPTSAWSERRLRGWWSTKRIPARVSTLIITDSNGTKWQLDRLPSYVGVLILPGAKVQDINNILDRDKLNDTIKELIIAVGINDTTTLIEDYALELSRLHEFLINNNGWFLELPRFEDKEGNVDPLIEERNSTALQICDDRFFSFDIEYISDGKPNSHHYTTGTAVQLLEMIKSQFLKN
jgi:hypothetical protein